MKLKKILAIAIATMTITANLSLLPVSASTTNSNFAIVIQSGKVNKDTVGVRKKANTSSVYLNYKNQVNGSSSSGPTKFRAYVYGSATSNGTMSDCTCYNTSIATYPVVTRGTKGFVKQVVCERFGRGSYALLYGSSAGSTGIARGCWSPDSVSESGTVNYN